MRLGGLSLVIVLLILGGSWPCRATTYDEQDKAAIAALDAAFAQFADATAPEDIRTGALELVHKVIERINRSHIHAFSVRELARYAEEGLRKRAEALGATSVEPADLAESATKAILTWLSDPYASYSARRMRDRASHIGDVGLELSVEGGRVKVIAPLEGGPADKAGVLPGDLIIEIDRVTVSGLGVAQVMEHLRGPLGSQAVLNIRRGRKPGIEIKVPRTRFQVVPLRHETLGQLAYIRIAFFGPRTEARLREALAAIRKEIGGGEALGYIIDLRGNPGGLVGQAILVADAFLEDGMIVATRGRDESGARTYPAYRGDFVDGRPIVVLINRSSASASEILAAALKDNGRAVLIGDRSFGKGVVQTLYPFGAWGQIRITTHKYMTASGRQIEEIGVRPHVWIGSEPQPPFDGETVPVEDCPPAGQAHDRLLGCAIVLLQAGGTVEGLLKSVPR